MLIITRFLWYALKDQSAMDFKLIPERKCHTEMRVKNYLSYKNIESVEKKELFCSFHQNLFALFTYM